MIIKSYEIQKNFNKFIKYNLVLLYGENEGLKKDIKENIKKILNKDDNTLETLSFYENNINENEENFFNTLLSGSLFSNKKIVIINNATDKIVDKLELIFEKKLENTYIIIFADVLEKKSKLRNLFEKNKDALCIPCYLDNERDLESIALNELKKNNIILSREIINLLIEKSNYDRGNLKNEIEKIILFSTNKKKINIEEIYELINFSGEYKSDVFVNECLCGNTLQYKKILNELYTNTINQIFLLRILSNKIHRLLKMKEVEKKYSTIDNLLNESKPPIFWKEKPLVKKQMSIWNLKDLNKIITEINETELLCKKHPNSSKTIFFNFFTKLCNQANSYS
tara:strand:+ start:273 stop:1292 length:1020 start_codon:yes stop_codon:yes gene_type:complete